MTAPAWLSGTLAGVMIATAAYCLGRMAAARRRQRRTSYDVDGIHVLMGVAMAGMLAPRLNPFAGTGWARDGWEVLFGLAAAWFGWRAVLGDRRRAARAWSSHTAHHVQHVLACGAMIYMFVLARASGSAAGMPMGGPGGTGLTRAGTGTGVPALALLLAVVLLGYTVWTTDTFKSLARVAGSQPGAGGQVPWLGSGASAAPMSARLSACCDIVMGVTMGYMLITML